MCVSYFPSMSSFSEFFPSGKSVLISTAPTHWTYYWFYIFLKCLNSYFELCSCCWGSCGAFAASCFEGHPQREGGRLKQGRWGWRKKRAHAWACYPLHEQGEGMDCTVSSLLTVKCLQKTCLLECWSIPKYSHRWEGGNLPSCPCQ